MEAVQPKKFTPFRGLGAVAVLVFGFVFVLDALIFHNVVQSSIRKPGQRINWIASPYSSLRLPMPDSKMPMAQRFFGGKWSFGQLSVSERRLHALQKSADKSAEKFVGRFIKP